jgi:chromosome segregation ATPase
VTKQEFDTVKNRLSLLEKDMAQESGDSGKKIVSVGSATKQELDTVRNRLSVLEKDVTAFSEKAGKDTVSSNSLTKQEFDALRNRLALLEKNLPAHEEKPSIASSNAWSDIHQSQRDIASLARRIDEVEKKQSRPVQYAEQKQGKNRQVSEDTSETRRELSRLMERMDDLEATALQREPAGREAGGYASALTKITLGLGMVAAFFMAR